MAFGSGLSMTLKAASLLIALGCATAQAAEEPAGEGRRMTVLIGTSPGSTFDLAGRLVSRHMAKFLPGKPNMVPQNMAGAGSVIAANYLSNTAPQDGGVMVCWCRPWCSTSCSSRATFSSTSPSCSGSAPIPIRPR